MDRWDEKAREVVHAASMGDGWTVVQIGHESWTYSDDDVDEVVDELRSEIATALRAAYASGMEDAARRMEADGDARAARLIRAELAKGGGNG